MLKKEGSLSFACGSLDLHSKFWGHLQANAMWMKSFTYTSCKSIRLLETIVSFSRTMPAYLQYGKELFASWSCHTPLTGVSGPDPYPISQPWDILGWRVHNPIPSQLLYFPHLNTSLLTNGNVFNRGGGVQLQASFKHAQKGS